MYNKKKAIICILLAGFSFAMMTFFVRLSGDLPTMQKVFFRNFISAIIATIMLLKSEEGFHFKKGGGFSLFMRCLCGSTGMVCNFFAIDHLNISDANMLNKMSPFFAIIASYFILKERATIREWCIVVLAFVGAMFVVKPSFRVDSIYSLVGLLGGLGAGVAYTFVRKLSKIGERSAVIVFCFSVFSCMLSLPFAIAGYEPMSLKQVGLLLLAGCAAAGGQFGITTAYTYAPAKEISVFDYSQVIFAAALGFFFLGQIPDAYSVVGYIIIIACAFFKAKEKDA